MLRFVAFALTSCLAVLSEQARLGQQTKVHVTGRFLHITDFHPDFFYEEGAPVSDICHHHPNSRDDVNAAFSKGHRTHHGVKAGKWGPPPASACDTPISVVNATFDFIKHVLVEEMGGLDFVVWTGDNARHDNDNRYPRTLKQIYESNEFMLERWAELFPRRDFGEQGFVPVVPTLGNNDVYPHNLMFAGPSSKTISNYKDMWKHIVPPEQSHTFDRGAYFHMQVLPGLSVVSLNSLYFFENNKAVDGCSSRDEPGSLQLDWLEIQLRLFRRSGMKSYIIGHVPPTQKQWYDGCFFRYADLMVEYRDVVVGQLFGHVNIDHFYFMNWQNPEIGPKAEKRGLSTLAKNPLDLLNDVRSDFDSLPVYPQQKNARKKHSMDELLGSWAVVNVAPSIVPNFFPTLRVMEYNTSGLQEHEPLQYRKRAMKKPKNKEKKKGKKRPGKSEPPAVDELGPAYLPQTFTPLKYTQFYMNTTRMNEEKGQPNVTFVKEYSTAEVPYCMRDLTVGSYVELARQLNGRHGLGKIGKKHEGESDAEIALEGDEIRDARRKKGNGKKKKGDSRNNGYWYVFLYRAFVSTGIEDDFLPKK